MTEYLVAKVEKGGVHVAGRHVTRFYGARKPKDGQTWVFIVGQDGLYPIGNVDQLGDGGLDAALRTAKPEEAASAIRGFLSTTPEAAHAVRQGVDEGIAQGPMRTIRRIGPDELDVGDWFADGYTVDLSLDGRLISLRQVLSSSLKAVNGRIVVPGLHVVSPFTEPCDVVLRVDARLTSWVGVLNDNPGHYGSGLGAALGLACDWALAERVPEPSIAPSP